MLRWSPGGHFLLVASCSQPRFEIWETHSWCAAPFIWSSPRPPHAPRRTSQSWTTGPCALVDAAWLGDEVLLLAFPSAADAPSRMDALRFVNPPPCLDANLLPLPLPALGGCIRCIAPGCAGKQQRLAVGVVAAAGKCCVTVYDLQSKPVLVASKRCDVAACSDADCNPFGVGFNVGGNRLAIRAGSQQMFVCV